MTMAMVVAVAAATRGRRAADAQTASGRRGPCGVGSQSEHAEGESGLRMRGVTRRGTDNAG